MTDWIALYNKQIDAPCKPTYNSPSDIVNFDKCEEENIEDTNFPCLDVDQTYFENFKIFFFIFLIIFYKI